jgi:16S rRNA processing protein RimM
LLTNYASQVFLDLRGFFIAVSRFMALTPFETTRLCPGTSLIPQNMTKEDCIELGYISKTQGARGEVRAILDVQDITSYQGIKLIYLSNKDAPLIPTLVTSFIPRDDKEAVLTFEGVGDKSAAEVFVGSSLFIPATFLPELPNDQLYYFEIEGFQVVDTQKGEIGIVDFVQEQNGNDLLVVNFQEKEILIPMHEDILLEVDKASKKVTVQLPEGLLELYLGD